MKVTQIATFILALAVTSILAAPVLGQETTASDVLPSAKTLGTGWTLINTVAPSDDLDSSLRDAAYGVYGGPGGARVVISVFLVAEGMTAIRKSWEIGGSIYDYYKTEIDYGFDSRREADLAVTELPAGCSDVRRIYGTENLGLETFPVGLTLCAADPDMVLMVYTSGEVAGTTGVDASDTVTALILSGSAATPTP